MSPWADIISGDNSKHYDHCRYYTGRPGRNLDPLEVRTASPENVQTSQVTGSSFRTFFLAEPLHPPKVTMGLSSRGTAENWTSQDENRLSVVERDQWVVSDGECRNGAGISIEKEGPERRHQNNNASSKDHQAAQTGIDLTHSSLIGWGCRRLEQGGQAQPVASQAQQRNYPASIKGYHATSMPNPYSSSSAWGRQQKPGSQTQSVAWRVQPQNIPAASIDYQSSSTVDNSTYSSLIAWGRRRLEQGGQVQSKTSQAQLGNK